MTIRQAVSIPSAPKPIGPYSQAVKAGDLLFISGQVPFVPETGAFVDGDIAAQTHQVLRNIGEILKAAGASYGNVVRTTVFLADMNDFPAMNTVYAGYFDQPAPARSTVQVARLPRDARIEIDVIAAIS
jgi:2-iminobutanoate/2-iminopropanoate deaminase